MIAMKHTLTALVLSLSLLVASGGGGSAGEGVRAKSENDVATMYRSSPVIENARTHMATFDGDKKSSERPTVCIQSAQRFLQMTAGCRQWGEYG